MKYGPRVRVDCSRTMPPRIESGRPIDVERLREVGSKDMESEGAGHIRSRMWEFMVGYRDRYTTRSSYTAAERHIH